MLWPIRKIRRSESVEIIGLFIFLSSALIAFVLKYPYDTRELNWDDPAWGAEAELRPAA